MSGGIPRWLRLTHRVDLGVSRLLFNAVRFFRHLFYFSFLGDRGLQALTDLYYSHQPLYSHEKHNRRGFFPWEADIVDRHLSETRRVLVTSCGAGREVLAFAARNCEVVGTECHPELAGIAQRLCEPLENIRIYCLPPTRLPPESERFDTVVLGWGGYTHLAPRSNRVAFLRELAAVLQPGGLLLISYLGRRSGDDRSVIPATRIANGFRRLTLRRPLEAGDTISLGFCHRFLPGEASDEAQEAGLEVVLETEAPPGLAAGQYPHLLARVPDGHKETRPGDNPITRA